MRWPSPLGDARREALLSASWSPRACTPLWRTQLCLAERPARWQTSLIWSRFERRPVTTVQLLRNLQAWRIPRILAATSSGGDGGETLVSSPKQTASRAAPRGLGSFPGMSSVIDVAALRFLRLPSLSILPCAARVSGLYCSEN